MFSNTSIKPVRKEKPHIVFRKGYWRVSAMPKPYHKYSDLFNDAYRFVHALNWSISAK